MSEAKNCLLIFGSKKSVNFEDAKKITDVFASRGYYFVRIEFVAFDDNGEITREICSCQAEFNAVVMLCPSIMESTLKNYVETQFNVRVDELGFMSAGGCSFVTLPKDCDYFAKINEVLDFFDKKYNYAHKALCLKMVGAPPERLNCAIEKSTAILPKLSFNVSEKFSEITLETVFPSDISKTVYDAVLRELLLELNSYVYAMENVSLADKLIQLLKLRRMKICIAESFTGGGVGKRLVEVAGASEVFFEGLNTYSNESKHNRLNVSEQTLKNYGAVSEQTAYEMAEGLLKEGNCGICISTTGIAGPKSDNTNKPVGLIYIGIGNVDEGISVYQYNLKGSREYITQTAINLALFLAYKSVK